MWLSVAYNVVLDFYQVDRSGNGIWILLGCSIRCFGPRFSRSIFFWISSTSATASAALSSTGPEYSWTLPRCLASLNKASQRSRFDKLLNKVSYFGALLSVVPDALVVAARKGGVCPRLRSSRSVKMNEFQITGFL